MEYMRKDTDNGSRKDNRNNRVMAMRIDLIRNIGKQPVEKNHPT